MIKFRKFIKSKTFYIIVSVLLGIMTWLLVLNYTNPTEKRSLDIPLHILNANTPASLGLSDRGSSVPTTITIKASGRSDIIGNLSASDLYAAVDFAKIKNAGAVTLKINKPECKRLGVTIEDYYPKTIDVMYDKMSRVNVDVVVDHDKNLFAEGFEMLSITPEPSSVQISGFESEIAEIDCIKVKLNESLGAGSIDSDKIGSFIGHYYLKSGEDVTSNYETEKITVKIEVAKRVPVVYSVTGTPHEDYYLNKTSITSDTVLLRGSASELRKINRIDLGKVDISGASSNVIKTSDIFLPTGVSLYQTSNITIFAEILKYETKTIEIDISSLNTPGKNTREYTYEFSNGPFNVVVKGKADDLAKLSTSSLGTEINLTDKGVGEYNLPLEFKGIDTSKYTIIGDYTCFVKIEEKFTPTPTPTPTPSEPTNTPES